MNEERNVVMKIKVLLIVALLLPATGLCALVADAVNPATPGAGKETDETRASPAAKPEVPDEKQTSLGLYLTAQEAYEKWKAAPETVKVLDVRTTEEYLFVGHAEMAWNIPSMLQTYEWDANKKKLPMKSNPDFVAQVKEVAKPSDTLLVMCRSGGRSAMAVNRLAEAEFRNVYNIIDGMEGDAVDDPISVFHNKRMRNGWKNSGLPWTYELVPERMRLLKR
jgi:rhodanese-related sulfurtransferase